MALSERGPVERIASYLSSEKTQQDAAMQAEPVMSPLDGDIRDGYEKESVSALVDDLQHVTEYRRKVGVYDDVLTSTGGWLSPTDGFGSGYNGVKNVEMAADEITEWNQDRDNLLFESASYSVDVDADPAQITIHVTATPSEDATPPTGQHGNIRIRGALPDGYAPQQYVDERVQT